MKELESRMIYGEMPARVETLFANTLQKEEPIVKKKSVAVIVLAAILILVLACTAFALSLHFSAGQEARRKARETVMESYGFTVDMFGFFMESVREEGKSTVVMYEPIKAEHPLGVYTVTLADGKEPVATWAYDGAKFDRGKFEAGDLDSPVWGPKQMDKVSAADKERRDIVNQLVEEYGPVEKWALEQWAALDQKLMEAGLISEPYAVNALPAADEVQPDKAVEIARETAQKRYGLSDEKLSGYKTRVSYWISPETKTPDYSVILNADETYGIYDQIVVRLEPKTGDVLGIEWGAQADRYALPEGPLDGYRDALAELLEARRGVLLHLSAAEKADLSKRLKDAGYLDMLQGVEYIAPSGVYQTEEEAFAAADKALMEKYGLTKESLELFTRSASFYEAAGKPCWKLSYSPRTQSIRLVYLDRIGVYTVILDGSTGETRDVLWSFADKGELEPPTDKNWADYEVWPARVLPSVVKLIEGTAPLEEAMGMGNLTLEEMAEYAGYMREAGFSYYYAALPDEKDVQQDEAREMVRLAIQTEYGRTEENIASYREVMSFNEYEDGRREWAVSMYSTSGREDWFYVTINAATGEIISMVYASQGNG